MANTEENKRKNRERKRKYRARHYVCTLSLSISEGRKLSQAAQDKKMTIPEYQKAILMASEQATGYVIPNDGILASLLLEIKRLGTNVNQITKHINTAKNVTYGDIEILQAQLEELTQIITQSLKHPEEITQVMTEYLKKHPDKLPVLIDWLKNYTA